MTDGPNRANRRSLSAWAIGVAGLLAGIAILFVVFGGDEDQLDARGDVAAIPGAAPEQVSEVPVPTSLADIVAADVATDGSQLVFTATTASSIPKELEESSLEFRFDLTNGSGSTWIVAATVNVDVTAAVTSQSMDYSANTIDGSLPGNVNASGQSITLTLEPDEIEGFPSDFEWSLSTDLVYFRSVPGSTHVEDRFPDTGTFSGP